MGIDADMFNSPEWMSEALPRISEAYITEIDQDFDGDTFFTMTDPDAWNIEEVGTFEDGGCTGRFTHWVRK